ncbi:MAG TPA: hypothetical protein DEF00_00540 [Candidatus Taylorbacteria bacterium]|nr:MAG: Lipolytic enzyme, G-D-S-L family [Parcubacteria group bacterium GW2011_GWA2_47_64]KKU96967.1 MAG: Lipolytic enzyme, G-D-S-L family [Parcubacteria group bacterium GW2011_GWC2_48_17]HBV00868.1 hypothetical protein [Candidatus Taylorbacteria bacterium]
MKKSFHSVVLVLSFALPAFSLSLRAADTGYTITASPTNLVVGEEFVVKWTVPLGTFTFDDWLGIFLVSASANDTVVWKYAAFRAGETVFDAPDNRGDYECRYFEWSLFGGSRHVATSETLRVRLSVENPFAVRNYPPRGRNIIAFGDSLVIGKGVAQGDDFPSELSRLLGKPIINAGVVGDTTDDALKRIQTDVLDKEPRLVVILLGGGDILDGRSPIEAVSNLKVIIERVHESGASVILVGVQGGLFTDRLRDGLHKLVEETKVAYVPNILRGIIGNPLLLSDAVHPNKEGYKLMANRIFPALSALNATPPEALSLSIAKGGKTVVIRWSGQSDKSYRVLASSNLNVASFAPLAVVPGRIGNEWSVSLPADLKAQFFRVQEASQ